MTSLAVLPPLKRSITDIMDEDLYQTAASPVRSDSPRPSSYMRGLANSLPTLQHATLSQPSNLSSLLNIPDSFMEHYNRLNGSNSNLNVPPSSLNNIMVDTDVTEPPAPQRINPFSDYGNPETLNTQQYIKPQQMSFPRRRRITTLEDVGVKSKQKRLKDEDYYLFNTDIQPSQLVNGLATDDFLYEESLYVPPAVTSVNDVDMSSYPIPGYESDYLLVDDFEEDAEDWSDDDDDDDNYFHDDHEFDDFIMNNTAPSDPDSMDFDMPLDEPKTDMVMGGFIDDFGVNRNIGHDKSSDIEVDEPSSSQPLSFVSPQAAELESGEVHFQTAAEISANNPDHRCDLINPLTGQSCNKQFSRPYDLIRHQETIHASKKKIFRCVICEGRLNGGLGNGKQKTFSRGDALSRHIKVKHGLVGKDALDLINEAKENVEYVSI